MLILTSSYRAVRSWVCGGVLALACLFLTGCGAEGPVRIPLEGAVSIGNQPLADGVVRFIPTGATHGPAAVATVKNGVYAFHDDEGVIPGTHRVEIEAKNHLGFALDDEAAFVEHIEKSGRGMPLNPVPPIYNRFSTIQVTVSEDSEPKQDFLLEAVPEYTAALSQR